MNYEERMQRRLDRMEDEHARTTERTERGLAPLRSPHHPSNHAPAQSPCVDCETPLTGAIPGDCTDCEINK